MCQVELCCWLGVEAVKALLGDKMSDAMRKDFERVLEDSSAGRKAPSRFTRRCRCWYRGQNVAERLHWP